MHVFTGHSKLMAFHVRSYQSPKTVNIKIQTLGTKKEKEIPNPIRSSDLESVPDPKLAPSGPPHSLSRRKPSSSNSNSNSQTLNSETNRIVSKHSRPSRFNLPFYQQNCFFILLLLMALSCFALAVFIFLGFDFNSASHSSASAAASEGVEITYGTVLKLMHEKTKVRLHSHEVPYGSGSGQQSVTGFPVVDDSNSYWIVRPQPETSAKQGDVIKSGTIIRLQHMRTQRWLHSHLYASPISGNLEHRFPIQHIIEGLYNAHQFPFDMVFGLQESIVALVSMAILQWRCGALRDQNNEIRAVVLKMMDFNLHDPGSGKTWKQDQRIRLQHVDTGGYLHSHDKKYSRIAGGQQEVCGVREKRADNVWLAAEGVYLPVTESK
ncbi:hypothetical protein TEA_011510 [Camellia sinensis var. sinensis]|uniref:MIR domain-containing protein n=1 Tax=Camellia sinensis var. sinensis TaxID=542762 RepID=A0A4S4E8P9_CAMSN|nr:hypothetical protein TEA_011510 [Camellia sinensis var. sinensis]